MNILYFASLKENLNTASEKIAIDADETVASIKNQLIEKNGDWFSLKQRTRDEHDKTRYFAADDVARVGGDDGVALDGELARVGRCGKGREEGERGAAAGPGPHSGRDGKARRRLTQGKALL